MTASSTITIFSFPFIIFFSVYFLLLCYCAIVLLCMGLGRNSWTGNRQPILGTTQLGYEICLGLPRLARACPSSPRRLAGTFPGISIVPKSLVSCMGFLWQRMAHKRLRPKSGRRIGTCSGPTSWQQQIHHQYSSSVIRMTTQAHQ